MTNQKLNPEIKAAWDEVFAATAALTEFTRRLVEGRAVGDKRAFLRELRRLNAEAKAAQVRFEELVGVRKKRVAKNVATGKQTRAKGWKK